MKNLVRLRYVFLVLVALALPAVADIYDAGGATTRVEAVIDSTLKPPSVIFRRDLTRLGPGYRSEQLIPTTTAK